MKRWIKNRKGQKLSLLIDKAKNPKGLAFVMHGLGGNKEEHHIVKASKAFNKKSYSTIRFDTTNTYGESDGRYEDATITNYYEDLEDVISWSKNQPFYKEPFILSGHSLGGFSVSYYAENHPNEVKALFPMSSVISGKLSMKAPKHSEEELKEWKEKGWKEWESSSVPGRIKRLPWSHMEDRLQYNLLEKADKLTMPVFMVVGENDKSTPPKHQKIFYEKIPGKKELRVIKGAPHTFREERHLRELGEVFLGWISNKNKL